MISMQDIPGWVSPDNRGASGGSAANWRWAVADDLEPRFYARNEIRPVAQAASKVQEDASFDEDDDEGEIFSVEIDRTVLLIGGAVLALVILTR